MLQEAWRDAGWCPDRGGLLVLVDILELGINHITVVRALGSARCAFAAGSLLCRLFRRRCLVHDLRQFVG